MATWKGYAFFRWRRYYIVGKIFEANIHHDFDDSQHGDAKFNIVYFSTTPPAGVKKESFAEDEDLLLPDTLIKELAQKAIEQSTIEIPKED